MTGMEKITQRITGDARQEADAILNQAKAQAGQISARYRAQADQETAAALDKGRLDAQERRRRLISAAEMEGRQKLLATKQELLEEAFDQALESLYALPEREYVALLAKLAVRASVTGGEELILAPADQKKGGQVVKQANQLLEKAGRNGKLTLSQKTGEFRGGLIVADGDVEVNCSFETLVRLTRNRISGEVASLLFS